MNREDENLQGPYLPLYAGLVAVALVLMEQFDLPRELAWWMFPIAGVASAALAAFVTVLQAAHRVEAGIGRTFIHRVLVFLLAGAWATTTALAGWNTGTVSSLCIGMLVMSLIGVFCQIPPVVTRAEVVADQKAAEKQAAEQAKLAEKQAAEQEKRMAELEKARLAEEARVEHEGLLTPDGRHWQPILRAVTKLKTIKVVTYEMWDNPHDGIRLFVELPTEEGTTADDLAPRCRNLAASARLPRGCVVEVKDSDTQGVVVLDVMLRNCLTQDNPLHVEPTAPARLSDRFSILTTARGELLSICLRITSMVLGGTTGSGKTTLLHRIIMFLARCTDTLIWIVDLNGGGVAEPWIYEWANGRAKKPVVDWVADSEEEGAVMVAVAAAIAKDRKTNREAARRKRDANDTVLPLDARMPGIVVITDEGGEVRQAASLVGQILTTGISRLAQIGRAEGIRTIMSVLRGTADLMDKGLRVVSTIRLCLRMEEHDEYQHVLGSTPPKTDLTEAIGSGFLKTDRIGRPVLGRTVNVDLATIAIHSVACDDYRPDLDEWGLRAAERVDAIAVLGGKQPDAILAAHPAFRDADDGRAYTGRWERYAAKLAEMRGEDLPEREEPARRPAAGPASNEDLAAAGAPALAAWASSFGVAAEDEEPAAAVGGGDVEGGAKIIPFPGGFSPRPIPNRPPAAATTAAPAYVGTETARDAILRLLREAGADGLATSEIVTKSGKAKSGVMEQIRLLREAGEIARGGRGNVLARHAATRTS